MGRYRFNNSIPPISTPATLCGSCRQRETVDREEEEEEADRFPLALPLALPLPDNQSFFCCISASGSAAATTRNSIEFHLVIS